MVNRTVINNAKRYAILQDAAYRKNKDLDQGFDFDSSEIIESFGFTDFIESDIAPNSTIKVKYRDGSPDGALTLSEDGNTHFFNEDTGFSAYVVKEKQDGVEKTIIVFRGTDSGLPVFDIILEGFRSRILDPKTPFNDNFDGIFANVAFGSGTVGKSQWDDVRALVDAVLETTKDADGNVDPSKLIVVGQSLGGGLASLASTVYGIEGYAYAPAPFAAQLDIEAEFQATEKIAQLISEGKLPYSVSNIFSNEESTLQKRFLLADLERSVEIGDFDLILERLDRVINSELLQSNQAKIFAAENLSDLFRSEINSNKTKYIEHIKNTDATKPILSSTSIEGETLSEPFQGDGGGSSELSADFLGLLLPVTSTTFSQYAGFESVASNRNNVFVDIGIGDSVSKHNFSIHNLVITTDGDDKSFGELLKNNNSLRHAWLDQGSISAPISHAREGDDNDPSKILASVLDTGIINRALWKSFRGLEGDAEKEFYNYFHTLFSEALQKGAAGQGHDEKGTELTLHSGVTKLALGILRDAAQNTRTLDGIKNNIKSGNSVNADSAINKNYNGTGFDNFAFAGDELNTQVYFDIKTSFLDELEDNFEKGVDFDTPEELRKLQLDTSILGDSQLHGIRDINNFIYDEVRDTFNSNEITNAIRDLNDRVLGFSFRSTKFIETYEEDNLYNKVPWEILVVQSGDDQGGLDYKPDDENKLNIDDEEKTANDRSHAIIGGAGKNIITGSLSDDIIVGGDGGNDFFWTGGEDIFVGGTGEDKLVFEKREPAQTDEDGNRIVPQGSFFYAGDGDDTVDYQKFEREKENNKDGIKIEFTEDDDSKNSAVIVVTEDEINSSLKTRDELYGVEEILLTNLDDTVSFEEFTPQDLDRLSEDFEGLVIDGALGTDRLDFTGFVGAIDSEIFDALENFKDVKIGELTFRSFNALTTALGDDRIFDTDENWSGGEAGEDSAAVDMKVRSILENDNLAEGGFSAFLDSINILNIFLDHKYNSLGSLESVSLGEGNDFLAADASRIVEGDEVVRQGLFEIKGEEGNDLLIAKDAAFVPAQDAIPDDPDTPEDESVPAQAERRLTIDGGTGNDWVLTRGGTGAITIGGEGRDFIFNTSEFGQIYGDTIDGLDADGNELNHEGLENSDVFWYWPGTFIQDAQPNDILQIFGIPLVGGSNSVAGIPAGDGSLAIDFFNWTTFYGTTTSGQLLVYNAIFDALDIGFEGREGVQVVEDYDFGGFSNEDYGRAAPGDLGLTFRIFLPRDRADEGVTISLFNAVWGTVFTYIDVLTNLAKLMCFVFIPPQTSRKYCY